MSLNSSCSANSNSKRSRNSTSSSINSDGKRRKDNQKTLGTAWGAQSHSSSRSSFRQAPFSDFGSYIAVKNQKLHEQFDAEASTSPHSGSNSARSIFQAVSIFVDGFTIPSSQELRAYMIKHGGRFENYFSKKRVTHIICSNLPKRIPYQLDQLAEMSDQPKLSAFFMLKSNGTIKDTDDSTTYGSKSTARFFGSTGDKIHEKNSLETDGSSDAIRFPLREIKDYWKGSMDVTSTDGSVGCSKDVSELQIGKSCSEDAGYSTVNAELQKEYTTEFHTFIQSSRLHFIGTWRNRYRKRYLSLSRESKDINASSTVCRGTIIHVDMDCFFVAVAIRNQADLQDKPVAVCHSDNPKGTAEISSANYSARIRAGMFVREAKALCPHLVIVPYNFEAYEEAVSCDEAFLEVTNSEKNDPEFLASTIRKEIFEATGCTASAAMKEELKSEVRILKPRAVYKAASLALEFESKLGHNQGPKPASHPISLISICIPIKHPNTNSQQPPTLPSNTPPANLQVPAKPWENEQ
ncbi:hypothetical protein V2J09_000807 [Rumex salicifolius]